MADRNQTTTVICYGDARSQAIGRKFAMQLCTSSSGSAERVGYHPYSLPRWGLEGNDEGRFRRLRAVMRQPDARRLSTMNSKQWLSGG